MDVKEHEGNDRMDDLKNLGAWRLFIKTGGLNCGPHQPHGHLLLD